MTQVADEKELRELGLTAAAEQVLFDRTLAQKLRIAFEHFRIIEPQHIKRFNEDLKQRTAKHTNYKVTYDILAFTPLAQYKKVPPAENLADLRKAKELNCFDDFEVATIASVEIRKDPIIFGRITGTDNRYFITQWDNDVKIEDILKPDEG